jgi:hypothetical protein
MKNKAIVSFAEVIDYTNMLEVALPSFYKYANTHNYDLIVPSHKYVLDTCHEHGWTYGERPTSWLKVPILKSLLKKYDTVLWLDCDVVIVRMDTDIAENFIDTDYTQAFTVHQTGEGFIPNMGIWLLNNNALGLLDTIWNQSQFIDHCWWEQRANMHVMNWDQRQPKNTQQKLTDFGLKSLELEYEWNVHVVDFRFRHRAEMGKFLHATQWPNRLEIMKRWASICAA